MDRCRMFVLTMGPRLTLDVARSPEMAMMFARHRLRLAVDRRTRKVRDR